MSIYQFISEKVQKNDKLFTLLIDPDRLMPEQIDDFIPFTDQNGVDLFFIGSSFLMSDFFDSYVARIKQNTDKPVIIFPGNPSQVSRNADALLFLSVISGRNPEHLIGSHVQAAPVIHQMKLETIPTGYMLIESGTLTAARFMNNSLPVPRDKPGLAVAHALAGQYLGLKMIYLEAGSGAKLSVPPEMIAAVKKHINIPLIAGGGIKNPEEAAEKAASGADIVVVGNHFEKEKNRGQIRQFSQAIHGN